MSWFCHSSRGEEQLLEDMFHTGDHNRVACELVLLGLRDVHRLPVLSVTLDVVFDSVVVLIVDIHQTETLARNEPSDAIWERVAVDVVRSGGREG